MSIITEANLDKYMEELGFPYTGDRQTKRDAQHAVFSAVRDSNDKAHTVLVQVRPWKDKNKMVGEPRIYWGYYRPDEASKIAKTMSRKRNIYVSFAVVVKDVEVF